MVSEQAEQGQSEFDAWPMPSADVRRELERRPLMWSEPTPEPEPLSAAA
jgi:hypothetical protein